MAFPIIDIIVVILLVCFVLMGLIKGFWRSLFALLSGFVTLILAILLAKPLASLLDGWFHIGNAFANSMHGSIESYVSEHGYSSGWMAMAMKIVLGNNYTDLVDGDDTSTLVNNFSAALGRLALVLICVVVLFILIKVLLHFLSKGLKKLTEKGVMKGVDKSLGAVFGLIRGAITVFICFAIMFELCSFITPVGDWFNGLLAYNPVSNFLYGLTKNLMQNVIVPFFTR